MNVHASPEEQRIVTEAGETPSMLDEKKFLEERRRRLEASLHNHVVELKDRSQHAGKIALVGAGAVAGVWLMAKALGSIGGARRRKKARALTAARAAGDTRALAPTAAARPPRPVPADRGAVRPAAPHAPATSALEFTTPEFSDHQKEPKLQPAPRPAAAPVPAGPSLFQTFMESEAGRMMTNQLVAVLMVFVTRKLESVLKIERSADIRAVKESDLTPYRIVDAASDATVVSDDAADSARPNAVAAPVAPSATT